VGHTGVIPDFIWLTAQVISEEHKKKDEATDLSGQITLIGP